MTKINFTKMSGAGNDFIIIDVRNNDFEFNAEQISKLSNRNNIGCDQFVLLKNSKKADIFMDIYNSDGSSSAACGNATRCVASIVMKQSGKKIVNIETFVGILNCYQEGGLIAVNMGKPIFDWQKIPLAREVDINYFQVDAFNNYHFSALSMGNPHIVTFLNREIDDEEFFRVAPKLEIDELFPQKTNVEFAHIVKSDHINVRVWERGAGETLACGSGACAVAVSAIKKDLVPNERIKVSFKGGDIFIEINQDGSVLMVGGYEDIFQGVIDEESIN